MNLPKPYFRPLPFAYKLLGVVLIAIFLLIGIVGLILPIIPGILFLFLALYVLTRVSRRAAAYAHGQPWFNRHMRHISAANQLSMSERVRLGFLIAARALVNGAQWCLAALRGAGRRS